MIVYLDTSVVLRVLFHEPRRLPLWGKWEKAYSSAVLRVESFRTIDRLRLSGQLNDEEVAHLRTEIQVVYETLFVVPLERTILQRAGESFPTVVGTLDAIHLSTALAVRESVPLEHFLTHDQQLGIAAQSLGFPVMGIK
jgi:predicted nucleic acid-binding protein